MHESQIRAKAQAIYDELSQKSVPAWRVKQLSTELDALDAASRTNSKAAGMASYASPNEFDGSANPGGFYDGSDAEAPYVPATKTFGWQPPSPLQLGPRQLQGMFHAMKSGLNGYRVELKSKSFSDGAGIRDKATPVAEGNITGGVNQLPPIIMPTRAMGLPYEPTRLMGYLPGAMMTGNSAAYLQHVSNAAEAAGVAEGAAKPDLAPVVVEKTIAPEKIAGLVSVTLEAEMDYPDFAEWLPTELARSVINAESLYLLQAGYTGGPTGAAFTGLLAQSGTLTRAVGTDTPLDAIQKAFVDLRTGPAFCDPDLLVMHPTTWGALRRTKDSQSRYLLDLLAGPAGLTWDGSRTADAVAATQQPGNTLPQGQHGASGGLWGIPICETTQCPAGTALAMGVKAGAAVGWVRMGMLLQWNPFGTEEWTKNFSTWRAEERISLSIPRPSAINIITGLPTS